MAVGHDVGRAINPRVVEGQIEGSIHHGSYIIFCVNNGKSRVRTLVIGATNRAAICLMPLCSVRGVLTGFSNYFPGRHTGICKAGCGAGQVPIYAGLPGGR
jgi:hypothetical protein